MLTECSEIQVFVPGNTANSRLPPTLLVMPARTKKMLNKEPHNTICTLQLNTSVKITNLVTPR